jgi:hypothetical protein
MTAAVTSRSAYPPAVTDLLPRVRELAAELGELPSQNRIRNEFRVGTRKARELHGALLDDRPLADTNPEPADTTPTEADPEQPAEPAVPEASPLPDPAVEPVTPPVPEPVPTLVEVPAAPATTAVESVRVGGHRVRPWPVLLLALPAFVAIWSGWVGLGELTGFGIVHPLPGIVDGFSLNTAITLPVGVETYAAYALWVWLSGRVPGRARSFAKRSAIGSLLLGVAGQAGYHVMAAWHIEHAPWPVTAAVASLPVLVLGMGAALAHLITADDES